MHFTGYTERPHGNRQDLRNLKRISHFLWDYRGRVAIALACLVLAKLANVGVPLLLKGIVDALDQTTPEGLTLPIILLLGYGLLRLFSSMFNELRDALFARVRYRAMRRIGGRMLDHLHNLSLRFHLDRRTGAISRDLERGAQSLSSILNYLTFSIVPIAVEFLLVIGILWVYYEIGFVIITAATVIVYVAFTLAVTEWRMQYRLRMNELDSEANSQAFDSLINFETVKYFGNEALEVSRYDDTLQEWEEAAVKSQTSMSALNFGQGAIIAIGVTLIMFLATSGVVEGSMSLGDLVLVNAFLIQLFLPLNLLGVVYRQLKHALADMDRMIRLLDQKPEIVDAPNAEPLSITAGSVRFEHVSFAYQPERPILHDISFEIPAGRKIAVVGPSGAGKSTLARLLFRFYDVTSGSVQIDGQDISRVQQDSLRAAMGIVPQDTVLFNETIRYNIVYANPQASQADIERAAKAAHIHTFIESLPDGYDTMVGERGLKLSGGEKQRVAIARAILKNPRILIFDEATSALDSHVEQQILKALKELAEHHTTLVIAHRLSTIVDSDEILVLKAGRIIERGDHPALLAHGNAYADMWAMQLKERSNQGLEAAAEGT
ncbi:MAG: ABC transporter ATP-binding protein/permease [Gammaproteobacteria bacterium]|nr:MAG: ABC transporter ATP-binding protein/permease [Gammaproteobacteria bacterium]